MVQNNAMKILHVEGKINPVDVLTKEDKDTEHYYSVRMYMYSQYPSYR